MGYVTSSYDTFRIGSIINFIASNLAANGDPFRGYLQYDGPNPEGERKSMRIKPYVMQKTTDEAAAPVQTPSGETRVSFEETYKMQVQQNTSTMKTSYNTFQMEYGRSLSVELNKLMASLFLTALTADVQILTTKYTTTNTPNLAVRTAAQDGVMIIPAKNTPDVTQLTDADYGITASTLMTARSMALAQDARYGTGFAGMLGSSRAFTTGTPFIVITEFDLLDLMLWQSGAELTTGKTTQYANIMPGVFHGLGSSDRGRRDLNGAIQTPSTDIYTLLGFALIVAPPAVQGPYGAETMLYQAAGVQKINLTGAGATGKIDIIYRIPIAHGLHIGRWVNERTGQMAHLSSVPGNSSVHYYDSTFNAGAHRSDGIGIVLVEVRRPYNYNRKTGAIIPPGSLISHFSLPAAGSTKDSGNKSLAESMPSANTSNWMHTDPKSSKMYIQRGNRDPQPYHLNEMPALEEMDNGNGGTILAMPDIPEAALRH